MPADYFDLCKQHGYDYREFKKNCDNYFYLPARQEHRGIGGIFFDDIDLSEESVAFARKLMGAWMPSWFPIVLEHRKRAFTEREKLWQKIRRGRYLEFNLLYDRGVKFGLQNANPRVEGVMVLAPPDIAYVYRHEPDEEQAKLVDVPYYSSEVSVFA